METGKSTGKVRPKFLDRPTQIRATAMMEEHCMTFGIIQDFRNPAQWHHP